jgi:hypothetical protein
MPAPNFLFIGPDKTGSSWLFDVLDEHPRCFVPPAKDIYFFDRHYERGLDWYLGFFADAPADALAVGELSHDYLFSPLAAERIRRHFPEMRLLTCLRDPVERTFSHYLYLVRSGLTAAPFEEALERFPELVDHSRYARHLEAWFARFDSRQIAVLWFDELVRDPAAFARDVFRFLEVPVVPLESIGRRTLPASRARSVALARLAKGGANAARMLGLANLVGVTKRSRLMRLLYRPYGDAERPVPGADTVRRLRRAFAPELRRLEELLGRRVERWHA